MALTSSAARLAGTFVAALTVAASFVEPASATVPGANGRIAFPGLSDWLYTMKLDGTGVQTLTRNGSDAHPAWSPDGGRIAFERGGVLYVMNADGTGLHSVGSLAGTHPTWSPDGTQIAYAENGTGLSVVNVDGSGLSELTSANDSFPRWSPDGSKLAFARYGTANGWGIWVMDADGGSPTSLFDSPLNDVSPDWSPDGSKLVFYSETNSGLQVVVMDADGSSPTQLTSIGQNSSPVFSPDGTLIAYQSSRGQGLWTMNIDGTNQVRRTRTVELSEPDWQPVQVTLGVSKTRVRFNAAVTLTVHLIDLATTNKTVSVYGTPYGRATELVGTGAVDGAGNVSLTVRVPRRTTFFATWSGDAQQLAGGTSERRTISVYPALRSRLAGYYTSLGRYRLYHFKRACPGSQRGCPTFVVSIAPDHSGKRLHFALQLRLARRWRAVLDFSERVPGTNKIVERFVYADRSVIGVPTRVRAVFRGDADHLATRTPWAYFRITR